MLQQEITNLIRTTLLIKSGELAHFDYLVESERKIEDMMANLDARASKDFVSAVNQILETVLQTKSTFAVHLNSLLFFPKGAELLRSNLSATEWQPVVLKLNSLERSVMQFNIAASNKKTKEELKFQLESLRLFIKELPPQLFTSVSQLIRHGEVLIDYSEKLHSLNKQLLSNSVAISSQKLIDLYHISSQLEVQYSNKIRSGFYFTLFLLSLYILFLWWRQKKIMVSELKKSTEKIILASRVFSDTHEGIAITDPDGTIIDINPTFCEITGYSREEIIGQNSKILRSGKQSPEYYEGVRATLLDEGHWQGEVWNCKKGGELYAENLTISALKDDGGKLLNYVRLFSDITKSKQQQEQLNLMAHYDLLTKLPNRALYQDRFSQAIAHSKRTDTQLAIGFLDLDNFKPVNDTFGHHLGDLLLVEVAERITANIRATDTVSRQGGDEFALLLGNIRTLAQCENMLKRIHESLANPYVINGHTINISASSGITLYSPDSADNSDLDTLIRHADHAMYQAKTQGRNRFHIFNTEEDQQLMTNDFRKEVQG
jgi:diguanylate cyclase (GGDEF)-like protein/PAS domain S-box-containing protein